MSLYRPKPRKGYRSPFWYFDFITNGVRYTGSTGKTNKIEARGVEAEKRESAKSGRPGEQVKPIRFEDFATEYLRLHGETKRAASFYDFTVRVIKRKFEGRMLSSITRLDCADFMATRRGEVKPSTANATLTVLKHMLAMAEEWGYLPEGANPARRLKREKVRNTRDRYLDAAGATALLDACTDWLRPVVMTALHTGGRRSEVLGLTWDRLDFKAGTITYIDCKNGDSRKVPMSDELRDTLKASPNRLKGGPVFLRGEEPVTNKILRSGFEAAVRKASLDGFRLHDCRHSWATALAMAGVPLRTLMVLGGWRRIEQVQRYAAVTPQSLDEAARTVNRVFKATPATVPQQAPTAGQEGVTGNPAEGVDSIVGAEDRT